MQARWNAMKETDRQEWCTQMWRSLQAKLPLFFRVAPAMRDVLWPTKDQLQWKVQRYEDATEALLPEAVPQSPCSIFAAAVEERRRQRTQAQSSCCFCCVCEVINATDFFAISPHTKNYHTRTRGRQVRRVSIHASTASPASTRRLELQSARTAPLARTRGRRRRRAWIHAPTAELTAPQQLEALQ